jgi:hypothetical protein
MQSSQRTYDVDPMHKSTSAKRKSFKLYAIASSATLALGAAGALVAGVTPASAASLAHQVDPQIAAFMVPLTILLFAILYEAGRIALRGNLPVEAPAHRTARRYWSPGRGEG